MNAATRTQTPRWTVRLVVRDAAGKQPPYMHAGPFATLGEVLAHYNRAPRATPRP